MTDKLPAGWVWWSCPRKGCDHRVPAHPATTEVYHRTGDGAEHPLKRERKP